MSITLSFTGSEAVVMARKMYVSNFAAKISEAQETIKAMMRIYKCDAVTAFNKYSRNTAVEGCGIQYLAAVHMMSQTYETGCQVKDLQEKQKQCGMQLIALESAKSISSDEKNQLRQLYSEQQDKYQTAIDQLIASFTVVGAQTIIHQTKLFSPGAAT